MVDVEEQLDLEAVQVEDDEHAQLLASQPSSESSASPVVKRRRTGVTNTSRASSVPTETVANGTTVCENDGGNVCIICMEPWTNTGPHQVCCMPCGHVFGYGCIRQWLNSPAHRVCPTCKHDGRIRDIRLLFGIPATLRTADVSEAVALRQKLEREVTSHAITKEKLREKQKQISTLRQSLKDCRQRNEVNNGVATFGDRSKTFDGLQAACSHKAMGEIQTAEFDNEAHVIFAEKQAENRFCLRRLDVRRGISPATPQCVYSKQVTDVSVNSFVQSDSFGYVAATERSRVVHIMNKELSEAGSFSTTTVPSSCTWLSSMNSAIAVGLMTGEVCVFDIRFLASEPLFQARIDTAGWRYIHSLGELSRSQGGFSGNIEANGVLLAGAPKGVYAASVGKDNFNFQLVPGTARYENEQVRGVTVKDRLLAVSRRDHDHGSLTVYQGLRWENNAFKFGDSLGSRIRGLSVEGAYAKTGLINGEIDGRDSMIVSPDSFSRTGISCWSSRRLERGDFEWRSAQVGLHDRPELSQVLANSTNSANAGRATRGVCVTTLPRAAKLDPLPQGCRGLACYFGDNHLDVYTCGRHNFP